VIEVLTNRELRAWLLWKIPHPLDAGHKPRQERPPYLSPRPESKAPKESLVITAPERLPQLVPLRQRGAPSGVKLKLAGTSWDLTSEQFLGIFRGELDGKLEDVEDRCALHRFAWLSELQENASAALLEKLIFAWIDSPPPRDLEDAWNAYCITERLANWGIFLCRSRVYERWPSERREKFVQSVRDQGEVLTNNLEYYGEALTGNHLANEGRGALWAALLTGDFHLSQVGEAILRKEYERIFQPSGMLREGSSHYQFLVTRNYLEAYWLAPHLALPELRDWLAERLPKMAEACRLLRVRGAWPLIGDLSPDCEPDWLVHVPEIVDLWIGQVPPKVQTQGWAGSFAEQVPPIRQEFDGVRRFDDFIRWDQGDLSLLVHVNAQGYPNVPGHGHRDTGCPVLFYRGQPLLMDRGRFNYTPEGELGLSAWAHNSVLLDDEEIEFHARGVFGPAYLLKRSGGGSKVQLNSQNLKQGVAITQSGWHRKGVELTRRFFLEDGRLRLVYELEGRGRHEVKILLHLPKKGLATVTWPRDDNPRTQVGPQPDSRLGWSSSRYGHKEDCLSYVWSDRVQLPWKGEVIVQPQP
jgi:hypothetical protein